MINLKLMQTNQSEGKQSMLPVKMDTKLTVLLQLYLFSGHQNVKDDNLIKTSHMLSVKINSVIVKLIFWCDVKDKFNLCTCIWCTSETNCLCLNCAFPRVFQLVYQLQQLNFFSSSPPEQFSNSLLYNHLLTCMYKQPLGQTDHLSHNHIQHYKSQENLLQH